MLCVLLSLSIKGQVLHDKKNAFHNPRLNKQAFNYHLSQRLPEFTALFTLPDLHRTRKYGGSSIRKGLYPRQPVVNRRSENSFQKA